MTLPLVLLCLWVLAAAAIAMLPMRYQILPGLALLAAGLGLILWLAVAHGLWISLAACVAFVSMFRKPLLYLAKRAFNRRLPDGEGREP
ncbi:MAG: DUF2484 family protein [Defluviimonas sp.]|uniref:DUF2484 family protein n=1 Tax=Albidovulum sp. TaxID=1872424 RepID=UPI001DEB322E|nr:DUF2484 family protein [Paracoccaceae bacterium]MCC0064902.1 DUF2484 family protein [Defluviimonas sp.]